MRRKRLNPVVAFLDLWWRYRDIAVEEGLVARGRRDVAPAGAAPGVDALIASVDEGRLREAVYRLSAWPRYPGDSRWHHAASAELIIAGFREAGLEVHEQAFRYGPLRGRNLLATVPGSEPVLRPLLVCAHYDTVQGSPGADDNASGIAVLMECAQVFAGARFRRPVEIAALDMEELQEPPGEAGLLGSGALARAAGKRGGYAGVYNLEMVGYSNGPGGQRFPPAFRHVFREAYRGVRARNFRGEGLALVGLGRGKRLSRRLERAAEQWTPGMPVVPIDVPSWLPIPDLLRSDHTSFWLAGMPAVTLTDSGNFRNPNYHGPGDGPETLDYGMLADAARLVVGAVAAHASEQPVD